MRPRRDAGPPGSPLLGIVRELDRREVQAEGRSHRPAPAVADGVVPGGRCAARRRGRALGAAVGALELERGQRAGQLSYFLVRSHWRLPQSTMSKTMMSPPPSPM